MPSFMPAFSYFIGVLGSEKSATRAAASCPKWPELIADSPHPPQQLREVHRGVNVFSGVREQLRAVAGRLRDGTARRGTAQRLIREARASRNVTIRMAEADLDLARKQAEEKGLPYQTYIKSVLHEELVKRQRRRSSI